jgi:hypothetical protein
MPQLPSGLPEHVADDEDLARFLTSSGHYNSTSVRHVAFLPNPKDGETSVYRHGPKPVGELWRIGSDVARDRNLHGVAFIKARQVREAQLEVYSAEPPPLHAGIRDWPEDNDPVLQKARRMDFAIKLAAAAGAPQMKWPR